jgi:putative transposase
MREESQRYNHYNHAVGLAVVYLIFWPKRRKKVLVGEVRKRLFEL